MAGTAPEEIEMEGKEEEMDEIAKLKAQQEDGLRRRRNKQEVARQNPKEYVPKVATKQLSRIESTWIVFVTIPIAIMVFSDLLFNGIHGEKTDFVVWFDVVGTVTFYRSRSQIFNLRDYPSNTTTYLWGVYVAALEYMLYGGGGLISKSILRGTIVLPTISGLFNFFVQGFIPGHFSPYDSLFRLTADFDSTYTRRIAFLVAFTWSISKIKSFRPFVEEIEYLHGLDVASALLLSIASCEIGTVISKAEMNYFNHRNDMLKRFPGGVWSLLTSSSFKASIACSIFMYIAVKMHDIFLVDLLFSYLAFAAILIKYSGDLLLQVYNENLLQNEQFLAKVEKLTSSKTTASDWLEEFENFRTSSSEFLIDFSRAAAVTGEIVTQDLKAFAASSGAYVKETQTRGTNQLISITDNINNAFSKSLQKIRELEWKGDWFKWKWSWW